MTETPCLYYIDQLLPSNVHSSWYMSRTRYFIHHSIAPEVTQTRQFIREQLLVHHVCPHL
jgi:hypothetical protein